MLGPVALTQSQLKVALKAAAGYEQQLYVSSAQYSDPGVFTCGGLNSGVYNPNVADGAVLLANPQELTAVLDGEVNSASPITVTVTGVDQFGTAYTMIAAFTPPSYVQTQENLYPRGYAVDLVNQGANPGARCASITTVTVACAADVAPLAIKIIGLPSTGSFVSGQTGAYRLISSKVKLDYNMGVPEPHAVQIGRDKAAQIKPGEIPEKTVMITSKLGSQGEGLMRINGLRVTGLVREIKEDKVETMRIFLPGLIITSEPSTGQSVEDVEATGKGIAERVAVLIAH